MHDLPRVADGWTFLYTERARIERRDSAIELVDENGRVPIPTATISTLLLGPGTTITHAAMLALAESGASIVWVGEGATKFYASGLGETHRAANLMAQAKAWADPAEHLEVVKRMYRARFPAGLPADLTLEQIRGHEGVRVRDAYARAGEEYGIDWNGRRYEAGNWDQADPVNRALSAGNACLYALCQAAIVATGFATGLGFIHTGKMLSFVYDVADLYKIDVTVPVAFRAAAGGSTDIEQRVRRELRDKMLRERLLQRVVPDIQRCLGLRAEIVRALVYRIGDRHTPELWDPNLAVVPGGRSFQEADDTGRVLDRGAPEEEVPF
jgi:CRISPR-associated protein Cas1